jgi:hypothetical protein
MHVAATGAAITPALPTDLTNPAKSRANTHSRRRRSLLSRVSGDFDDKIVDLL